MQVRVGVISSGLSSYGYDLREADDLKITTVNCTVVDPKNFDERSFVTVRTARIYANEGLCLILFFLSDEVCGTSYTDRKRKYQAQKGIVLPEL